MIPGLTIHHVLLPPWRQEHLLASILRLLDHGETSSDGGSGRSRVLRFGFDYDPPHTWLCECPLELAVLPESCRYDSVTINEYEPRHGIAPHIDSGAFPGPIHIISLGAPAVMRFSRNSIVREMPLPPGSLLTMDGEARERWSHAVMPVKEMRWSVVYRLRGTARNKGCSPSVVTAIPA